jgi:hypothetical protein
MRKIFFIAALILYVGLTFTYLTILQTTTAQVQLPTTTPTTNVTLLNKTATNDTVSNSNNDTTGSG